ncbi:Hypothetical protein YALI2_A00199g [Yarrowia lipolytica]|nr:Hypothetical protein YALI2_A00199g [Yarrowia lipolytica]
MHSEEVIDMCLYQPGTDYYGRHYGGLAYQEHDVYDPFFDESYDILASNGPGPYPSHAYVNAEESHELLADYSAFVSDPNYLAHFTSDELRSDSSNPDEYPSPILEHPQFDPSCEPVDSSYFSALPYTYGQCDQQNLASAIDLIPEPLSDVSETSDLESASSSFPTPPKSTQSDSSPPPLQDLQDILPKDVCLAQNPNAKPLLPSDPASVVAQLYASPEMWRKACHTKKGVFICTNCHHNGKPLSFRTMIELAMHFDSHGLMRKSKCDKSSCPWSVVGFSTRSEKNRHHKSQHSDLNFPCQTCGRRFGRCDSLKRHMKLVHDIVPAKKSFRKNSRKTSITPESEAEVTSVAAPSSPVLESDRADSKPKSPSLRWTNPQSYYSYVTRG